MRARLGKKEKLKSKKHIDMLFAEGLSVSKFPLKLLYVKIPPKEREAQIKVGFSVPKRNFKHAVGRNYIKRLLREAYRCNKQDVFNNTEGRFALLFLYLGREVPTYQQIEKSVKIILQRFLAEKTKQYEQKKKG